MGENFTAKDFRTWGGTLIACCSLAQTKEKTEKARQKAIVKCVKDVAKQLGNTPAVAKSSYIDPLVFKIYLKSDILTGFNNAVAHMKTDKYFKPEEKATLNMLRQYKK
jgi:DNA topoisomerase-1